jgi:serine/threonine protein kinase
VTSDRDVQPTVNLTGDGLHAAETQGETPRKGGALAPPSLGGRFEFVKELGRGGMGIVYEARDTQLGRHVAIKRLLSTQPTGTAAKRFEIEAQAVSRLQHPGIVKVHEFVVEGESLVLVMDLVPGSLRAKLDHGPLDVRDAATLAVELASALQHAHEQRILHRDIKPANVLLNEDGRAMLTDFGLARDLSDERERLTLSGQILGTPSYMSPEQALGDSKSVDERSDVYSVGATLYEMLTGQPPLHANSFLEVVTAIACRVPVAPSTLRREVDTGLDAICLKCLEKSQSARYASAKELADDLRHYLAGDAISAELPGSRLRLARWARKNWSLVASLAVAAPLITVATLAVAFPSTAERTPPAPPTPVKETKGSKAGSDATPVDDAPKPIAPAIALVHASGFGRGDDQELTFVSASRFLNWNPRSQRVDFWELGHDTKHHTVRFPFATKAVAPTSRNVVAAGAGASGQLLLARCGLESEAPPDSRPVGGPTGLAVCASLNKHSRTLVVAREASLEQYSLADLGAPPTVLDTWTFGMGPGWIRHDPTGRYVVGSQDAGLIGSGAPDLVRVWDTHPKTSGLILTRSLLGKPYFAILSPDGRSVVVGTSAGSASLFDLRRPRSPPTQFKSLPTKGLSENPFDMVISQAHRGPIRAGAFSPDGARVYLVGGQTDPPFGEFVVWNPTTGTAQYRLAWKRSLVAVAASPDGSHSVAMDASGILVTWRLAP